MDGSITLGRCDGPACPRCGCCDCRILTHPQPGQTWYASGQARCNHCSTRFSFREVKPSAAAVVVDPSPVQLPPTEIQSHGPFSTRVDVMQPVVSIMMDPTRCPECGGKGLVKSTQGNTQYRQCKECGERYKTQKAAG